MINGVELETPERDLGLENRDAAPRKREWPEVKALRDENARLTSQVAGYRDRVEKARRLEPKELHRVHNCRTCFRSARDATIKAIEGE